MNENKTYLYRSVYTGRSDNTTNLIVVDYNGKELEKVAGNTPRANELLKLYDDLWLMPKDQNPIIHQDVSRHSYKLKGEYYENSDY
jgi:hypothetical protein